MPVCAACDESLGQRAFSSNQLRYGIGWSRCIGCVRNGRAVGHARSLREAAAQEREQLAREERERLAREEHERLERERLEREEQERLARVERERLERERQERARRDAELEAGLSQRICDLAETEGRLKSLKRRLAADLATTPAQIRYRLTDGPVRASLRPMPEWDAATALTWFDETFAWSDLYRDAFRLHRVDGSMLCMVGDQSRPAITHRSVGVLDPLHGEALLNELAQHGTFPPRSVGTSAPAPAIVGECVVCVDEPATLAALPCGHLCLCATCAENLPRDGAGGSRRCPICRNAIAQTQRIYVSTSRLGAIGVKRQRVEG